MQQIGTRGRPVPKAVNPFDKLITGIVGLDVLDLDQKHGTGRFRRECSHRSARVHRS